MVTGLNFFSFLFIIHPHGTTELLTVGFSLEGIQRGFLPAVPLTPTDRFCVCTDSSV